MNDTTSTPDEPDGRGRVATGEQAAIPQQQAAGAQGAAADVAPATNGSAPARADGNAEPAAAAQAADPAPDRGAGPAGGSAAVDPAAATASDPTGSEAPTAQLRLPSMGSAGAAAADAAPAPEAASARPSPAPRAPEPEPAPGPVPGPGPEAAAPPPWHRMPGRDTAEQPTQQVAPEAPASGGGLLDEGPTAFLEPPSRQEDTTRTDGGSAAESGSWSSVRSVRNRPPRQATLQLKRFDPWSALKLGLVLAVVLFFIWLVAVGVLYGALDGMGVWDRLNGTYADLVSGDTPTGSPLISAGRVFGFAAVIGAINSLLFAVAVTVGAFVYNVSADLVGGIEVTLSERD
ncbi:DUF3566 domain-containing protein [Pseudonocardia kunmingensis]|uniref:Transmembrane protein DUF3566 n=1 Tax=Pseudonocardia kunmingensis TaxID=630975 RepID=A0A543E3K0_9PSEU|nr:transmembrane protein DUF3566 [Pseudonocardia kunmingensis]